MASSVSIPNPVMDRMRAGQPALGMTVRLGHSGDIVRIAKATGHDFVFIDVQHSLFNLETIGHMAQVALGCGIAAQVRVRSVDDPNVSVYLDNDVKTALARLKPRIALYVGGMGAKNMNFHKDNMVTRGFGDAANRIQELFLAGRKDEATDAVPDEFVDQGALVGPAERIKERWKLWQDCGMTDILIGNANMEVVELMGRVAR